MADKVIVSKSKVTALADSIRAKAGTTGAMSFDAMKTTVDGISGGGSASVSINSYKKVSHLTNIKPLGNTGTISTICININLSNEDMLNILNQLPDEAFLYGDCYTIADFNNGANGISFYRSPIDDENKYFMYFLEDYNDLIGCWYDEEIGAEYAIDEPIGWRNDSIIASLDENLCLDLTSIFGNSVTLSDKYEAEFEDEEDIPIGTYNEFIKNIIAEYWNVSHENIIDNSIDLSGIYEATELTVSGDVSINPFNETVNRKIITKIKVEDTLQQKINYSSSPYVGLFHAYNGDYNLFKNLKFTKKLEVGNYMFNNCRGDGIFPLALDISNLRYGNYMFASASLNTKLPTVYPKLYQANYMFEYNNELEEFEHSGSGNFEGQNMFHNCTNLKKVNFSKNITLTTLQGMFWNCTNLISVSAKLNKTNISSGDTFTNCTNLTNLELIDIYSSLRVASGTSWGHLLTVESLIGLCKECINRGASISNVLTIGSANLDKIQNSGKYFKFVDPAVTEVAVGEKGEIEECALNVTGSFTITDYMAMKNWTLA